MTGANQSKEQIVAALRDKMSRILSIPASSIDNSKSIWALFPPNKGRAEAKEVTEFCSYVSDEYKVYLTEREWEAPTLARLAEHIVDKQSNPQHMLSQIEKDRKDMKKGLKISLTAVPVLFGPIGVLLFFTSDKPKTLEFACKTGLTMLGLIGVMELIFLALWYRESGRVSRQTKPVLEFYNSGRKVKS